MTQQDNRLRLLIERVERIDEEILGLQRDRRDVLAEAKAVGYDLKTFRTVLARRRMPAEDRAEADMLVETYEMALGGQVPDPAVDPSLAAREMAEAILAEQIDGISDPQQAAQLVEHVTGLLDLRAEIADLRRMEGERVKLAKAEGFEPGPLKAVVRWLEKCAKHGRDLMRAGEAVFQMYRGTVEGRGTPDPARSTSDPKLQAAFGKKLTPAKARARDATDAWLNSGLGD